MLLNIICLISIVLLFGCTQPDKENSYVSKSLDNDINRSIQSLEDSYERDMRKIDKELSFIMRGL